MASQDYQQLLTQIRQYFPAPVSNPVLDGYFIHTISQFLDKVDEFKTGSPILEDSERADFLSHLSEELPEHVSSMEDITKWLAEYCRGLMIWSHPKCHSQVVPPTTIAGITAVIAAALYNPNIIQDEYSFRFADAEIQAIKMVSNLIGLDADKSGGVFTFGGTGTLLYGVKMALERQTDGRSMATGVRNDYKLVASSASHFSKLNVAAWLGLGTNNVISVATTHNNEMDLVVLEQRLRELFTAQQRVAAIIVTVGTTDAFGLDDVAAVVEMRDRLAKEFNLTKAPHIHADAVIGWVWTVFRDYDWQENKLAFHARTLKALQDSLSLISGLKYADSIGIDFHKTGYAPYLSSLFLVKDRESLNLLSRHPEEMPYLYHYGHYHPGFFTLECSRSGGSPLSAVANLLLLGKQGYQSIIGHIVNMALLLRQKLSEHESIVVLNEQNYGPVTLFRVYPDGINAKQQYLLERDNRDYLDQLIHHNKFNEGISEHLFKQAREGNGALLSWTSGYQTPNYPGATIAALKSYIMSPNTDEVAIDEIVQQILRVRRLQIEQGVSGEGA